MINLVLWLLFGALVGWLASMVMRTDAQQGALLNIVVGIIGALIGGFLFGANDDQPERLQPDGAAGLVRRRGRAAGDCQPRPPRLGSLTPDTKQMETVKGDRDKSDHPSCY